MKQKLLFDIEDDDIFSDKCPIRILYKPSLEEHTKMKAMLSNSTKNDLQICATPFLKLIEKYHFRFKCEDGSTIIPEPISLFKKSKLHPKATWIEFLILFYNEQNYSIIFEDMSEQELELWRKVARNRYVKEDDVNKIMGKECFYNTQRFYDSKKLIAPLSEYFYVSRMNGDTAQWGSYRDEASYIHVGYARVKIILQKFYSNLINAKGTKTLPKDADFKTYNGETFIFAKLPILASIYEGELMGRGFTKLTATTVKKLQKVLSLPDFFQTFPNGKQPSLSASLVLNFYLFFRAFYHNHEKLPTQPEQLVKAIIRETFRFNSLLLSVCLPYIKGIKKSLISISNCEYIMATILYLFRKHHEEGWLSIDSLIMKTRTIDALSDEHFMLVETYNLSNTSMRNGYNNDQFIHPGNIIKSLSEPFFRSLMFMLSTYGIVEIAYTEPKEGESSYYNGLKYVRLTELGKYVLGLTDSYIPKHSEDNEPPFELDEQRLFIKVIKQDSPFESLLTEYADKIMPSLYRVNYDSFLRGCFSFKEVNRKIEMFQQYICKDVPSIWKQFFKDITERCNSLSFEETDYTIIRLSPGNIPLQRLILTEPGIKKYVLKAEDYLLLIKTKEIRALRTALRKFGYLL